MTEVYWLLNDLLYTLLSSRSSHVSARDFTVVMITRTLIYQVQLQMNAVFVFSQWSIEKKIDLLNKHFLFQFMAPIY